MPLEDFSTSSLRSVILRAEQRLAWQLALREALLGLTIALAGVAVLLALGTDLFPAWLLGGSLLVGAAVGVYRWVRARPSPYEVAQRVDVRWRSEDQISTAYYFLANPSKASPLASQQRQMAEKLALSGDLMTALPFRLPKAAYALGGMILLLAGLLGLRYGFQRTLSLKPPLAPLVARALLAGENERAAAEETSQEPLKAGKEPPSSLTEQGEVNRDARREMSEPLTEPLPQDEAAQDYGAEADFPMPEVQGLSLDEQYGDELAGNAAGEKGEPEGDLKAESLTDPSNAAEPGSQQQETSSPDAGAMNEESNDLLSRLKDAFENMLSALSLDQPSTGQNAEQGQQSQQMSEQRADSSQAGGGESQQSGEGESESQTAGEGSADTPQMAQGKGGDQGSEQSPEGMTAASAGSNDGSKEISEAAQLQAMGELSELYNRRAAEMTGEVMIETQSARQSLQTPYQTTDAGHEDPGGTVSRDEIPLAYRSFIQTYFQTLRQKNKN